MLSDLIDIVSTLGLVILILVKTKCNKVVVEEPSPSGEGSGSDCFYESDRLMLKNIHEKVVMSRYDSKK